MTVTSKSLEDLGAVDKPKRRGRPPKSASVEDAPVSIPEAAPEPTAREVRQADRLAKRRQAIMEKLPMVRDRYRRAYGVELTDAILKEYVEECRKREIFDFLEAKVGRLFDADRKIMLELLG